MVVTADDQTNLWKGTGAPLLFVVLEMGYCDHEVRFPANFRQKPLEGLDCIQNCNTHNVIRMTLAFHLLGRQADEAKPDSSRIYYGVLPDFGDRCLEIRRQDWKFRFPQTQAQRVLTVIEFVVADRAGVISDLVHCLDHWRAFELVCEEGSG